MSFVITTERAVSSCRACPRVHNDAWDHDDPFTAVPASSWGCTEPGGPVCISDTSVIHARCPLSQSCISDPQVSTRVHES